MAEVNPAVVRERQSGFKGVAPFAGPKRRDSALAHGFLNCIITTNMAVLSFIAEVLKAVAWPITVLVLALLFRKDLAALLSRISALKHKDTEVTFGQELAKAADRVVESHHAEMESLSEPEAKKSVAILEISPSAAILSAWVDFEIAVREVIEDSDGKRPRSVNALFKELVTRGLIDDDDLDFLYLLRELRNRVAHAPSDELDKATASKAVTVLHQLAWEIRNPEKAKRLRKQAI